MEDLPQPPQDNAWSAAVAAKKIGVFLTGLLSASLTSVILSPKIAAFLAHIGYSVTPQWAAMVSASIAGAVIAWAHDLVKLKTKWTWL